MDEFESLAHSKWQCKYHVVFIPTCRRKVIYGQLRRNLGDVFKRLAEQRECVILEGHLMADHVHMLISIPPKYSVAQVVGFIKGKSAIHIARTYGERKRNFVGQSFWARGYFVSTVGRDEAMIRGYIQKQEKACETPADFASPSRPPRNRSSALDAPCLDLHVKPPPPTTSRAALSRLGPP